MPTAPKRASACFTALLLLSASPAAAAPGPSPATPTAPASAAPAAAQTPVVIRIGTSAVMTIREPQGSISVAERGAVVQSRIDQVLLHHPYLTWMDVKILREGALPTLYWGPFPITQVDADHARVNNFSSPDLLAHVWANSMRAAIKAFFAAKHMPTRVLYHTGRGNDYTYRLGQGTLDKPTLLRNTRYIFSPQDFEYGAGAKDPGQNGWVIFVKKEGRTPPEHVYLGNGSGSFTEYDFIKPEDTP